MFLLQSTPSNLDLIKSYIIFNVLEIWIMKNESLLNPKQVAEMLGVSRSTFELMTAKSQTPAPIMIGKRRFWLKAILKSWIAGGFQVIS